MQLADRVNTFGRAMRARHGCKVHKLSIEAGFTCPNLDGSRGHGGCTFCNNRSFVPVDRNRPAVAQQIANGRRVVTRRTGAARFIAYFQAYTNTYADPKELDALYRAALAEPDVIGLAVGTRPDCVPDAVLDLLAGYRDQGFEIWLELGLQSAFDRTLEAVNRGHDFAEYIDAVRRAHQRELQVCTHLILGLPGEDRTHYRITLERVLETGVDGLKLHPLHVVKGTQLQLAYRRGEYEPLGQAEYVDAVVELVRDAPERLVYHRLTATAPENLLIAPRWCARKWPVLNAIATGLARPEREEELCSAELAS